MTSWLKVECQVHLIGELCIQIQNKSNLRTHKISWCDLLRNEHKSTGIDLNLINHSLKGMLICFYFSTRLSSILVFDKKKNPTRTTLPRINFTSNFTFIDSLNMLK